MMIIAAGPERPAGRARYEDFRDIVRSENLSEQWYAFSTDRQMGRSREFLADHGIRVG